MGKGQHDWRWHLKRMKGHLRHGTGGTGGDETEVEVASQLFPWVQAVREGAFLSGGPGTWEIQRYFFTFELSKMCRSNSKERKTV